MTIRALQWYPYRIPLPNSFTTTHEKLATREGLIVEIQTEDGQTGIGECAPLPAFGGGTLQDVETYLSHISTQLIDLSLTTALQMLHARSEQQENIPTPGSYGVETALLDLLGKKTDCSLGLLLADPHILLHPSEPEPQLRRKVQVNSVIGMASIEATVVQARSAIRQGFSCLKIKVGHNDLQTEIERLAAVRAAVGPDIHLRIDANEAWNFEQAYTFLRQCTDFALQYVEQPLVRHDLAGAQKLRGLVQVPIAADEAVSDLDSTQTILSAEAADILIIKPQLIGGLRSGRQIIQAATARNVQCVITSTIETGIGLTSALHLAAASPEVSLECGLATLSMLEDDLITQAPTIEQGNMTVPTGPGLGVQLDHEALQRYQTHK